ncbi:MAG: KAP family NTPase [Lachnospiraceae bacterium]|nr:KAP family NTPase [Lachnospiraceae bacterium]
MTNKELNNYIYHYLKKDKTQTAIMLTGEWGSGKTYYIEHVLIPFLKEKKATCVVVSLYGLEDTSAISKSIYMELRMRTLAGKASETVTTGRVIAKNVIKGITGKVGLDFTLSDEDLNELYESVNLKDKLLILEDIERSNICMPELLGYVNGLVERDKVKVLLVANENEILKKKTIKIESDFTFMHKDKQNQEEKQQNISEDVKQYLQIKEKTVSDTIQFSGNTRIAVEEIIKGFDNARINSIINDDVLKKISEVVSSTCKKNLRTFIYALQKSVDIMDKMEEFQFENDFFFYLLYGIINLSGTIKSGEFPKWEGNEYLSTKLGSNNIPLMRFAYDYIRWQTFDMEAVNQTYKAYREFRFFERNAEDNYPDLRVLGNYAKETECNVLNALNNIEKKLQIPDAIGIHAYCKLAYYMICVGAAVGFDCENACNLMLKNARGLGKKANTRADKFFAHTYDIEDDILKEKYEYFIKKLAEAIEFEQEQASFSYEPNALNELYTDICMDTAKYTRGHQFISKYDLTKIISMLLDSSSAQIDDFRGILFAVYRDARKNEFDEKDVEALRKLLELVEETRNGEHNWDKIQLMQINWLCLNLEQFIKQIE